MERNLKVGDTVKIRQDLKVGDGGVDGVTAVTAVRDMLKYRGQVAHIAKIVRAGVFELEDDPEKWHWTASMFEPNFTDEQSFTRDDLKDGMLVQTRSDRYYFILNDHVIGKHMIFPDLTTLFDLDLKGSQQDENFDIVAVYDNFSGYCGYEALLNPEMYHKTVFREISAEEALTTLEKWYGCKLKVKGDDKFGTK